MPTPNAAAGCWRGGCWRRARVAAAGSACCTRPASTSSWRGWRPRASARSRCPSAPSRRRSSCVTCSPAPTSTCCSVCPRTAATTTRPGSHDALGEDVARAPSPTVPFLRHVWLEEGFGTLEALAVRVPDAVLDAVEDDVTPDDRMVIVHTSGSTSAPKGVLHQHGSLLGHLESLNRLRGLDAGGAPVLQLAHVLGRWARLQRRRRARRRRHPPVLGLARPGRDARLHRARTTRAHQRVRRVDRRTGRAPELRSRRDFSSIRWRATSTRLLPDAIRPADPELRHNMLGTTETGSVCLMDPDETDQPEGRRGSFGRPVPGLDARVVDPDTPRGRRAGGGG